MIRCNGSMPDHNTICREATKKRVFVESLGCAGNRADADRIQRLYWASGWEPTSDPADADLIILQTCGFTRFQEGVNLARLETLQTIKKADARLMVGGCLPWINPKAVEHIDRRDTFGPRTLQRATAAMDPVSNLADVPAFAASTEEAGTALVRVATGCLDRCSFCAIPFANGRISSRSLEGITRDLVEAHSQGFRRVHLVAEDIGAWGRDTGLTLLDLLDHILALPLDLSYQLDNLNPNWLTDLNELIERLAAPKILKRFYIPVQSGSDTVLQRMQRRYTTRDLLDIFSVFHGRFPSAKYSTDFIVGFPGESDKEFEESRALLLRLQPHFLSVYAYEERPRVAASRLPAQVPLQVKEKRARVMIAEMLGIEASRRGVSTVQELASRAQENRGLPINTNVGVMPE